MPVFSSPACVANDNCEQLPFPQGSANCNPEISNGGVNDVYFLPCTETISESNLLNTTWWQTLVDDGNLGAVGVIVGSIVRGNVRNVRVGSCQTEQPVSMTWNLTFEIRLIDKTSEKVTHEQADALIQRFGQYQAIARMCDGDNTVLPIGPFTTTDLNWTVPNNFEEEQVVSVTISWQQLGLPRPYTVAGLSAIVPKAKPGLPTVGSSNS
jgi:hypothetical protein